MRAELRPLRLPAVPQLSLAYFVNELGNWLGEVALAILVFNETGSELAVASLFLAMLFLPALATPALVSRLEHLPARRSLPLLYAIEAAAFAGLAVLADNFLLVAVLSVAALDGALASTSRSLTRAAAAAVLAPAGQLREGNAILNVGFTVAAAAGPALAGVVVAGASIQTALLADAASFLIVAVLLATTRGLPKPQVDVGRWVERLRSGLEYVRTRFVLRRLLAAQSAAFIAFAVVIPIEVAFAKETLDAGDAGYGALLASWGIGMVAGSILFAALRRVPLPRLLVGSTLAIGLAYIATGAAPSLFLACVASAVGGTGNGIQWVSFVTAIQELTRSAYQARVIALLESLASAMPGIGFLIGGAVAALASPRAAYLGAGVGVLCALALAIWWLRGAEWRRELETAEEVAEAGEVAPARPLADPHRPADTSVAS
jgi:MFS family permease